MNFTILFTPILLSYVVALNLLNSILCKMISNRNNETHLLLYQTYQNQTTFQSQNNDIRRLCTISTKILIIKKASNQKRKRPFSDVQIGERLTMVMET